MNRYAQVIAPANTPQSSPVVGETMVENNAGGYVFELSKWGMLDRFLILGAESPTYYCSKEFVIRKNVKCLDDCVKEDSVRTVERILELDADNRAPKMDTLIFSMAYVHSFGDARGKEAVKNSLHQLLRTGTHLFMYVDILRKLEQSMSRNKRTAISDILNGWNADKFAYQVTKYRNREGYTWRDLLRLVHPRPVTPQHDAVMNFAVNGKVQEGKPLPEHILLFLEVQSAEEKRIIELVSNGQITHEMIPSEKITKDVLEALAYKMPAAAMLRNLGRLSSKGVLTPLSNVEDHVVKMISNGDWIKHSRVHPIAILSALRQYSSGGGYRSSNTWTASQRVVAALNDAFIESFKCVPSTGKRFLLGLDVSGSMSAGIIAGVPGLTPFEAEMCMAMATIKSEEKVYSCGFSDTFRELHMNKSDSVQSVLDRYRLMAFGRTDCAQPMIHALKNKLNVDTFVVYTGNETWHGQVHPYVALHRYRKDTGINAKLIVVGMTATNFTIAKPDDPGMLDVVGFDASAPKIISEF